MEILNKIKKWLCIHNCVHIQSLIYYAQEKGFLVPYAVNVEMHKCSKCGKTKHPYFIIWEEPML